jgi:Tfp pilus assembly protein PilF
MVKVLAWALCPLILLLFIAGCGKEPTDLAGLKKAAAASLEKGENRKALVYLTKAMSLAPSDKEILMTMAEAYKKEGVTDSALSYFRRADKLYPRDRRINRELIELYRATDNTEGALGAIAVMVATGDNEKIYWPLLAELYTKLNDKKNAAKYWRFLMIEYPTEPNYYLQYSNALTSLNKYEEANQVLAQALERFGPAAEGYANMAVNYLNLRQFDNAEENFRRSLELNPNSPLTWLNLANLLSGSDERAKMEEALGIYQRFRGQAPEAMRLDSLIGALESRLR